MDEMMNLKTFNNEQLVMEDMDGWKVPLSLKSPTQSGSM